MTGVSEVVVNEEAVSGNAESLKIYQDLKEKPAYFFYCYDFKICKFIYMVERSTIGTSIYTYFLVCLLVKTNLEILILLQVMVKSDG